jgi:hypothetical protein
MNKRALSLSILAAALTGALPAQAHESIVYALPTAEPAAGIPYQLGFYFHDTGTATVKSDDVLEVLGAAAGTTATVARTGSRSWSNDLNTDVNKDGEKSLLGWTHSSRWGLVDVSGLKTGYKRATVRITISRLDDGNHAAEDLDDDLVPAISVWRGIDTTGAQSAWYPNVFQITERYEDPAGSGNFRNWWSTLDGKGLFAASATPMMPQKVVYEQTIVLSKDANNNVLTFVIGGNDSDAAMTKHSVNFKVQVDVKGLGKIAVAAP